MKTFKTLITVSGLRRADPACQRLPIGEGEVIALPEGFARSLLGSDAIEPTDGDVTVELDWGEPVSLIRSDDVIALRDALISADFSSQPDMTGMQIVSTGIAPTDLQALAQALEAQGATVVLRGEEWPSSIDKVDLPLLLAEVVRRIDTDELTAAALPEELLGLAATILTPPEIPSASENEGGAPSPVEDKEAAPAKPARKGKASADA